METRNFIRIPSLKQWGWTLLSLVLSTALGFVFYLFDFTEANIITVYILGVLITTLITKNYICSTAFSIISVFLFDLFFVAPMFSLIPLDSGYPATFAIMLLSSLITGTLANKLAASAKLSSNSAYRMSIMLQTNKLLQKAEEEDVIINIVVQQLLKLLDRNISVYKAEGNKLSEPEFFSKDVDIKYPALLYQKESNVAFCAYQNNRCSGVGTDLQSASIGTYYPIGISNAVFFVIGIETRAKAIENFENSIVVSILGEAALAIENLRNSKEKEEVALLAKNEQLRANLLRAISHDLRTPLTSISGNAENLLMNFDNIDEETRRKILTDVGDDAEWLIALVENLLSVSRISEGRMNINMSVQLADEVITEALRHISRKAKNHRILTDFGNDLLLAKMDARLISQVIINLVDNAVKYTPEGSVIVVSAKDEGKNIRISVSDNGEGIPDEQKKDVFRMFYTGKNDVADCRRSLGLGLSLCESIIAAHGSQLILSDNNPHGCNFIFTLKKSEVNISE